MALAVETHADLSDNFTSPVAGKIGDDAPVQTEQVDSQEVASTDEPTQEQPEPAAEHDDDRYFAHLDLMAKMAECERERREAFTNWESLKSEAKEAKADHDSLVTRMQRIAGEIADLLAGKTPPKPEPANQSADREQSDDQSDDGWRELPTSDLLAGLKGMGKKKMEAICDAAPTVGHLEDLRGNASRAHKPFKEVLPDGFGDKVAGEIEDRLIDHIGKWSSQAPVADSQEPEAPEESEDQPRPDVEELVKKTRKEAIDDEWGEDECAQANTDDAVYETSEGFKAFQEGKAYAEIPDYFDASQVEYWVYGWVSAERLKQLQDIKPTPATDFASL